MSLLSHMCPKCDYYMPLLFTKVKDVTTSQERTDCKRQCRNCGYSQDETPGLVMKMAIQEKAGDAFKIILNEFTKEDPRLPHVDTLPCPNADCPTNTTDVKKDVIYMKYDGENMKFLYICTRCDTKWKSR